MLLRIMSLMAGLLLAAPAAAEGRGPAMWGEGGLWEIYAPPGRSDCFATRLFLSGTVMRIGVRADGGLDLLMARSSWRFAEAGKTYRLKFVFGNGRTYEEDLEAVATGSTIALVNARMSAAFVADFMEKTQPARLPPRFAGRAPGVARHLRRRHPTQDVQRMPLQERRTPAIRPCSEQIRRAPAPRQAARRYARRAAPDRLRAG